MSAFVQEFENIWDDCDRFWEHFWCRKGFKWFQKLFENPEVNILKTLLDSMASPALRNENGPQWTPLHAAALQEEGKACMLLMEGRANPLEKDTEGISAEKSTRSNMFQCSRMFHVGNTTFSLFHFSIPVASGRILFCSSLCGVLVFDSVSRSSSLSHRRLPVTHNSVTHHLSHTKLCHTPLCHTQLCHTPLCHTQLCHTPSLAYNFVTHLFVTQHLSHTTLSHNSSHTTCLTSRSSTTSFVFPSFPVRLQLVSAYWKKLTCGVIRSFIFICSIFCMFVRLHLVHWRWMLVPFPD